MTTTQSLNAYSGKLFDEVQSHNQEDKTTEPAPPTFFQQVADFLKPVTNFFASALRFFGFN
jgi:hypothetical protein